LAVRPRERSTVTRLIVLARTIHEYAFRVVRSPSPCPSPPPGARGSERLPSLGEGEGQSEGGALWGIHSEVSLASAI